MYIEFTIVDEDRKPIAGSLKLFSGLQQRGVVIDVPATGMGVDVPAEITQIEVSSPGYHSYVAHVDNLYDKTQIFLEKKSDLSLYLIVAGGVLAYWLLNKKKGRGKSKKRKK